MKSKRFAWIFVIVLILSSFICQGIEIQRSIFGIEEEMEFSKDNLETLEIIDDGDLAYGEDNIKYWNVKIAGEDYMVTRVDDSGQYYIAQGQEPLIDTEFYQWVISGFIDEEITTSNIEIEEKFDHYNLFGREDEEEREILAQIQDGTFFDDDEDSSGSDEGVESDDTGVGADAESISLESILDDRDIMRNKEFLGKDGSGNVYFYDEEERKIVRLSENVESREDPFSSGEVVSEAIVYDQEGTNANGAVIQNMYKISGDGEKEWLSSSIVKEDGTRIVLDDQRVLGEVIDQIKSDERGIDVIEEGKVITVTKDRKKVLDIITGTEQDPGASQRTFVRYDNDGIIQSESTYIIENSDGRVNYVLEKEVLWDKEIRDDGSVSSIVGVEYSYSSGKRQRQGLLYEEYDEYGRVIENKKVELDSSGNVISGSDSEAISKAKREFSKLSWRERFSYIDYVLEEYSGMGYFSSLLLPDDVLESWKENIDKVFNNVILGGPRYWASEICERQYDISSEDVVLAEKPGGVLMPAAHIEAEKSESQPIMQGSSYVMANLYKMSFYVESSYEDIVFNVILVSKNNVRRLFENDIILEGDEDGEGDSYEFNCRTNQYCAQYSTQDYEQICLVFFEQGNLDRDELCNIIVESNYEDISIQDIVGESRAGTYSRDDLGEQGGGSSIEGSEEGQQGVGMASSETQEQVPLRI